MPDHLLLVFTTPADGEEAAYHDFYNTTHLSEMVKAAGVVSAQRFELVGSEDGATLPSTFAAVYEIDGDLETAKAAIAASRDDRTPMPAAVSAPKRFWLSAISDRVTS